MEEYLGAGRRPALKPAVSNQFFVGMLNATVPSILLWAAIYFAIRRFL